MKDKTDKQKKLIRQTKIKINNNNGKKGNYNWVSIWRFLCVKIMNTNDVWSVIQKELCYFGEDTVELHYTATSSFIFSFYSYTVY